MVVSTASSGDSRRPSTGTVIRRIVKVMTQPNITSDCHYECRNGTRDSAAFAQAFVERLRALTGSDAPFIALHEPQFCGNEWAFVKECLDTGWVSSSGKFVNIFEAAVAE